MNNLKNVRILDEVVIKSTKIEAEGEATI